MINIPRVRILFCLSIVLSLFITLSTNADALGEYDGVWVGSEAVSVPGYDTETLTAGSIVYQNDSNSLDIWDELLGTVTVVRSGSKWVLPSPITTNYSGYNVKVTSVLISFPNTSSLTGTIVMNFTSLGITATATLSHSKKTCHVLTNDQVVSGIYGTVESVRCYQIDLPDDSSNLKVTTSGGTGDADLSIAYHRPDFNYVISENYYNQEQISVSAPTSGKWYIAIIGFEAYSGLNLHVSYTKLPTILPVSISGDSVFDLRDVILGLQVAAGISSPLIIDKGADINNDGKVGMEEVIQALKVMSE